MAPTGTKPLRRPLAVGVGTKAFISLGSKTSRNKWGGWKIVYVTVHRRSNVDTAIIRPIRIRLHTPRLHDQHRWGEPACFTSCASFPSLCNPLFCNCTSTMQNIWMFVLWSHHMQSRCDMLLGFLMTLHTVPQRRVVSWELLRNHVSWAPCTYRVSSSPYLGTGTC
jgi:hypothetical protein